MVIGGGLTGLYLSYLLKQRDIECLVLEGSSRLGGRIHTVKGSLDTPLELGATWFSDLHVNLLKLINELGLRKFPQFSQGISLFETKSFAPAQEFYVPESESPSYRMEGGTGTLIDALKSKLRPNQIKLNDKVIQVEEIANQLVLKTKGGKEYHADKVVICMPTQLVSSTISFVPSLSPSLMDLLATVQTWMAGAIKFTLEYSDPFWRHNGYSGMLFSHAGIITEMYDHTNYEVSKYGFTGFLSAAAKSYSEPVRKELVLKQLVSLFGEQAAKPSTYYDKVWTAEFIIQGTPEIQRPHQNNGHPFLHDAQMNGKLFFCGTETSSAYSGYMEGALVAAQKVAKQL